MTLLRRPSAQLAGCLWLPRFIDKTRLHLAGRLPPEYHLPYCHPVGTDGAFLAHFGLEAAALVAAIRDAGTDEVAVAAWFERQPGCTPERRAAWNALGPQLGRPGQPVHRGFLLMLKLYHGGRSPDPRVDSVFTAIAWDEGYLDELVPPIAAG